MAGIRSDITNAALPAGCRPCSHAPERGRDTRLYANAIRLPARMVPCIMNVLGWVSVIAVFAASVDQRFDKATQPPQTATAVACCDPPHS
jgi:hypothetical protein